MTRRVPVRTVLGALCCVVLSAALAAELPKGFRLEPVLTGLTEPSAIEVAADGRIFVAERTTGSVRLVQGGELLASPVCTFSVSTTGEGGLLGIALHPSFQANGWLYAYYTSGGQAKVTRTTISGLACGGNVDILSNLGTAPTGTRLGGALAFGPDGRLFVATGDFETGPDAQADALPAGKVLRVNDDGSIPSDNPTPGSLVFAKGVRNGRGLAVNAAGQVYLTDAGVDPTADDEFNTVMAGDNLGWDFENGLPSTAPYKDPLAAWTPVVGVRGMAFYGSTVFPDATADGIDNDGDAFGADHYRGVARTNDDTDGICVGSTNNDLPCTTNANCPPRVVIFTEASFCELRDEPDEYCPGGAPKGDDACGSAGTKGIDEADESFLNNLFFAAHDGNALYRAVMKAGALDQLSKTEVFLNSGAMADCPDGWTDMAPGRDGFLYAVARNAGGAAGALYRVIHDAAPGPREVSKPGTSFPLRVDRGATASEVVISFEDLRSDATQPRDDGNADPGLRQPLPPAREYAVWQGTIGNWTSHALVPGQDAIAGTAVNEALRKTTVNAGTGNSYFLVSARSSNLQGSLGKRSDGVERTGYASKDVCSTLGYHASASYDLWKCGQDFTLKDEHGETRSLYEFRGQVIVLDLSAIWCPPCRSEADVLENVNVAYRDRGVQFLTVLMDEDNQLVDFLGRPTQMECTNWGDRAAPNPDHTFPCIMDPNVSSPAVKQAWPKYNKHGALPTNVVLDTGLRVVYSGAGYDEATIKDKLDRLVGTVDACLQ